MCATAVYYIFSRCVIKIIMKYQLTNAMYIGYVHARLSQSLCVLRMRDKSVGVAGCTRSIARGRGWEARQHFFLYPVPSFQW